MKRFSETSWSVTLPNDWVSEHDETSVTLYQPGGAGTLQVSTINEDEEITEADLKQMASDHLEAGAMPEQIEFGDFDGIAFSYDDEDEYWHEWYLKCGTVMLFVTYNCDVVDEGKEDDVVEAILETLKINEG